MQPRDVARREALETGGEGQEVRGVEMALVLRPAARWPSSRASSAAAVSGACACRVEALQDLVQPGAVVALLDFVVELLGIAQAEHAQRDRTGTDRRAAPRTRWRSAGRATAMVRSAAAAAPERARGRRSVARQPRSPGPFPFAASTPDRAVRAADSAPAPRRRRRRDAAATASGSAGVARTPASRHRAARRASGCPTPGPARRRAAMAPAHSHRGAFRRPRARRWRRTAATSHARAA